MRVVLLASIVASAVAQTNSFFNSPQGFAPAIPDNCTEIKSYNGLSQIVCRDGSSFVQDNFNEYSPFFTDRGGFPVVATHGEGAGASCGYYSNCESCTTQSGCIWELGINKCLSDNSCRGDPYCQSAPQQCGTQQYQSANLVGASPNFAVINGIEVAVPESGQIQWSVANPNKVPIQTGKLSWNAGNSMSNSSPLLSSSVQSVLQQSSPLTMNSQTYSRPTYQNQMQLGQNTPQLQILSSLNSSKSPLQNYQTTSTIQGYQSNITGQRYQTMPTAQSYQNTATAQSYQNTAPTQSYEQYVASGRKTFG